MFLYTVIFIILVVQFKAALAALPFGSAAMLAGILLMLAALIRMTIKQAALLAVMIALTVGLWFYVQFRLVVPQKIEPQVRTVFTEPQPTGPKNPLPQKPDEPQELPPLHSSSVEKSLPPATEPLPPAADDYTPQMPTALPTQKPRSASEQLLAAAKGGDLEAVKTTLAQGADPNAREAKWRETPLHWAAMYNHAEIVKLLLASGADVHAKEAGGRTPLHWSRNVEITKRLLAAGADVNARDNVGYTPLIEAATGGRADIAKVLLEAGADVDAYGKDKRTALGWAAMYGQPEVARVLLDANASINIPDGVGKTPWAWASLNHHDDILQLMTAAKQRQ